MIPLETDRKNDQEAALYAAGRHYTALLREGYNRDNARFQAITYLRRKTGLAWPLAAGAFDSHNTDGSSPT